MIQKRLVITFLTFAALFLMALTRSFYLQVFKRAELQKYAKSQFWRESTVYPNRGNIFDRNGSPLAINTQSYDLFTIPKNVKDENEYKELAKIVDGLTYKKIKKKIGKRQKFTWLSRGISLEQHQVEKIKALSHVHIDESPKRIYPNNELLAQVLGFVGLDNKGLGGIEFMFDDELKGKPLIIRYVRDAKGRAIKISAVNEVERPPMDIFLTVDKEIQAASEKFLKEGIVNSKADGGGIGVMDVRTGEILAIASYPTFDPNNPAKYRGLNRRLGFVTDPVEPGSVFKTLTVAAALESKVAKPDTNFYCEKGSFTIGSHTINEAEKKKKHEWLSVTEILKQSSNVGTSKIAFSLGDKEFLEWMSKFGIGKKTGISIPAESKGIFNYKDSAPDLELATMSFGQGVAVTGLQMLSFYAAVANGGRLIPPTIIKDREDDEREVEKIFSPETAKMLQKMLVEAVEDGTGGRARIPHYSIAGKTSTAQRVDPRGGYNGYVPGFIGFPLNVNSPFVIFVYVDNPKGKYYGNQIAAPIFKKVAQYILYRNKDINVVAQTEYSLKKNSHNTIKKKKRRSRKIQKGVMPNLMGLDRRSAIETLDLIGVSAHHDGVGVVTKQLPKAGNAIKKDTQIILHYRPPMYE